MRLLEIAVLAALLALPARPQAGPTCAAPLAPTILKVFVPAGTRLKAGAEVNGRLNSEEPVRFVIDRAWKERAPGPRKSILSWILRPLDFPAQQSFIAASSVKRQAGPPTAVSVLRIAKGKNKERIIWFQSAQPTATPFPATGAGLTIPAGTRLHAALVTPLHSALNPNGHQVRAVLTEPVTLPGAGNQILPAGTEITGHVRRAQRARWLSRPGHLDLTFQKISTPCGSATADVSASLSALDPAEATPLSLDREGGISGGPQSKVKLALQIGASYAIGKLADDLLEEGLKAAVGAAAGTAATAARYPGMGLGVALFAIQRGREVSLPAWQEVEITIGRAVELR